MNAHHRRAVLVIAVAACLDAAAGIAFGYAQHIGPWNGLYFATTTATTVGYGDITPHGWLAHLIALGIQLTVIPLFASSFSLMTSGFTSDQVHAAKTEIKDHVTKQIRGTDRGTSGLQWAGNDLRLMMEGEDVVAEGNGVGTYRGRHEKLTVAVADPKLIDVDAILEEGRQALLAWEIAPEGSPVERRAGMRVGEVLATLDAECKRGNLPVDWRPPAHETWTEYQRGLVTLWGTCHCGGPRNSKYVTDGAAIKCVLYCTICGDEPS